MPQKRKRIDWVDELLKAYFAIKGKNDLGQKETEEESLRLSVAGFKVIRKALPKSLRNSLGAKRLDRKARIFFDNPQKKKKGVDKSVH